MMLSVVGEEVIRDGWVRQGSSSGRPGKRLGLREVTRFDKRRCGDRGKKLHCKRVATHYSQSWHPFFPKQHKQSTATVALADNVGHRARYHF